jgi:hypothetical protein
MCYRKRVNVTATKICLGPNSFIDVSRKLSVYMQLLEIEAYVYIVVY